MTPAGAFAAARDLLAEAHAARAFPAAVVDVGRASSSIWAEPIGRLTYDAAAPATRLDTWFDLASLTKVIATVPLAMRLAREGRVPLEAPVSRWLGRWTAGARHGVTVRQLLDHSSGLPAHAPLWREVRGRDAIAGAIFDLPLAYAPGSQSVYSDLGFMLLGFVLEQAAGTPLDRAFAGLAPLLGEIDYRPAASLRARIAPTEHQPERGLVHGEVHDENAAALDGVAAHAGLFGTAAAVAAYARLVLRTLREPTALGSPDLLLEFVSKTGVPGSSRALGWDTMLPTSSCGTRMSARAFGHTGFTGTSLWIDPARDLYVVLLSNRVHPTRDNEQLRLLRPRVHDAIVGAADRLP
jgi:CubicO group peptidase (beta-lactamase class C family)